MPNDKAETVATGIYQLSLNPIPTGQPPPGMDT